MAQNEIPLGTTPPGEASMRPGDGGYADLAFLQCRRYIALLRRAIGPEPEGARLRVRRSDADIDPYLDVTVEYDDENPVAQPRPPHRDGLPRPGSDAPGPGSRDPRDPVADTVKARRIRSDGSSARIRVDGTPALRSQDRPYEVMGAERQKFRSR